MHVCLSCREGEIDGKTGTFPGSYVKCLTGVQKSVSGLEHNQTGGSSVAAAPVTHPVASVETAAPAPATPQVTMCTVCLCPSPTLLAIVALSFLAFVPSTLPVCKYTLNIIQELRRSLLASSSHNYIFIYM